MYFQILERDLKRKKTMNVILLIFILLAVTFIASSVNNMVSVVTTLDSYLEKANIPEYCFSTMDGREMKRFERFARERDYDYRCLEMLQINPQDIKIDGRAFAYSNSACISSLKNSTKVFDEEEQNITRVGRGEIYVTAELFYSDQFHMKKGSRIKISLDGKTREFTLKGCMKDAMFGSSMFGMTRMLVSEEDFAYFRKDASAMMYFVGVYEDAKDFKGEFGKLMLNTMFGLDGDEIQFMYLMDMLTAAIILIVSVCLILISMVMLHFMIRFSIAEEFREIGVMKAIGISNFRIRGLYITKYFAISMAGMVIGFLVSIPFGNLMLDGASRNMIMARVGVWLNLLCAIVAAMGVVWFCYLCTGKVKSLSPVDAIRKGENGERFSKKGFFRLGRGRLRPVFFLAINDIFSGAGRFFSMLLIFTLGILLIIIPVNSINTLRSDGLLSWFNMAPCDHVLDKETIFTSVGNSKERLENDLEEIRGVLRDDGIRAKVFREVMYRMSISYQDKTMSSLAFIGLGDVEADAYAYLEGTAPQRADEVAITKVVSEKIGAKIGDDVEIKNGERTKTYRVTAINQSMNNMGEGIRFYQEEALDFSYAVGCFGTQIQYQDGPDAGEKDRRKEFLKERFQDYKTYTAGEYINQMIGDAAGQMDGMRQMIVLVVLVINILVTVLMVKSFITKEKGEIGMLKAIGFGNGSLVIWQSLRIGIVLLMATVLAVLLSTPLSQVSVAYVFQMMGAYHIEFEIKPLEVYVLYPLLVLVVTTATGMLASLQIRKISPSETSNIE